MPLSTKEKCAQVIEKQLTAADTDIGFEYNR